MTRWRVPPTITLAVSISIGQIGWQQAFGLFSRVISLKWSSLISKEPLGRRDGDPETPPVAVGGWGGGVRSISGLREALRV